MEKTKIQLSEDELLLMQNSDWILTKNSIIEKMITGFGSLANQMQQYLVDNQLMIDESVTENSAKVSRGEKYLGLPYIILDYPRIFGREDILAIRTLFWWGNYCSITLHAKGIWQEVVLQNLVALLERLKMNSFYISYSGNEWSHDILHSDYIILQELSNEQMLQKLPGSEFLKLAAKVEIGLWVNMEENLFDLFICLVKLLKP